MEVKGSHWVNNATGTVTEALQPEEQLECLSWVSRFLLSTVSFLSQTEIKELMQMQKNV